MTGLVSAPTASALSLGLCLGTREVGVAVVSRDRLVAIKVLALAPDRSGKRVAQRLVDAVRNLLTLYNVGRVAIVVRGHLGTAEAAIRIQSAWIRDVATRRGVEIAQFTSAQVRAIHGVTSARALANRLGLRFPEIAAQTPAVRATRRKAFTPAVRRPLVTDHERYWSRAFLALAGVLHLRDQAASSSSTPFSQRLCPNQSQAEPST